MVVRNGESSAAGLNQSKERAAHLIAAVGERMVGGARTGDGKAA